MILLNNLLYINWPSEGFVVNFEKLLKIPYSIYNNLTEITCPR